MTPTRRTSTEPPSSRPPTRPNDIAYWMGRVDASLLEVRSLFEQSAKLNEQNWDEEREWQKCVNDDLAMLDKRLTALEQRFKGDKQQDDDDRSVTWKWIVDKLVVPLVTAITVFILLEVIPAVVK